MRDAVIQNITKVLSQIYSDRYGVTVKVVAK